MVGPVGCNGLQPYHDAPYKLHSRFPHPTRINYGHYEGRDSTTEQNMWYRISCQLNVCCSEMCMKNV